MNYYIDSENVVWRNINGEVIVLNLNSGYHYSLNKSGSIVWLLIEKNKTSEEITKKISEKYNISHDEAKKDATAIINDLKHESLVYARKS